MKIFIYSVLLALLSACKYPSRDSNLPKIDIEANVGNMEVINLSEFTENVKYVKLETRNDIPFRNTFDIDISLGNILISDFNVCFLYDSIGNFISKIGTKGRGPGEYSSVMKINLGVNGKIYLSDLDDLFEYSNNGSLMKKYNRCIWNENYYVPTWYPINDSVFFGHIPNSNGKAKSKALLFDKSGHILHSYSNYLFFNRNNPEMNTMENHACIYKYKNMVYYKGVYDDTLFYLTDNFELAPRYIFNLGKYKQPASDLENNMRNDDKYIHLYNVFQTNNYLFIDCNFGDHFPARRLTPKNTSFPSPILFNTRFILGIFNKKTSKLSFCNPNRTDNPLFTSGLYNDIDGGPMFFPRKQVNDSTMIMWIEAKQLKDHISSDDFKNNMPKYPEKKKQLEELAASLDASDNPVLMFVTFKNK